MQKIEFRVKEYPVFSINLIQKNGVLLTDICNCKEGGCTLCVDIKDCQKVRDLLDANNVEYSDNESKTKQEASNNLLSIICFAVGSVIGIFCIAIYSMFVFDISVIGVKSVSLATINELIDVQTPALIRSINTDEIENKLVNCNGIMYAKVKIVGNTLVVKIEEEAPSVKVKNEGEALLSPYSGTIQKIVVTSGSANVKEGDIVKVGEPLILPYVVYSDGTQKQTTAEGEVYIKVWFDKHIVYPDKCITKVRTGKSEHILDVSILGIKSNKHTTFSSYQTETETKTLCNIIPLTFTATTYYQTEDREVDYNFAERQTENIQTALASLEAELPKDANKVRWWYYIKRLDKSTKIDIYYEIIIVIT